jgi:integrase
MTALPQPAPSHVRISLKGGDDMARRRGQRRGWLREDGGSWLLTYRLYDALSRVKRETVTIGPATGPGKITKKQAERFAWDHYLSKVDTVAVHPKATITVEQFWRDKYAPHLELTKRSRTRGQYTYLWGKYLQPAIGDLPMVAVDLETAEALLAEMSAAGLAPGTVYHAKKVGSAIVTRAKKLRYFVGDNPFQLVELSAGRAPVKELIALTVKQALAVLDLAGNHRAIIETGLLTGMNVAELLGLQIGDIRDGWIHVERQYSHRDHPKDKPWTVGYGGLKHANRRRMIPVCGRLEEILASHNSNVRGCSVGHGHGPAGIAGVTVGKSSGDTTGGTGMLDLRSRALLDSSSPVAHTAPQRDRGLLGRPIFSGRTHRPVNDQNIRRRVLVPIGEKLGLPGPLGWHTLRHTFATWLEDCGVREFDRQCLLGHAPRTQTQHYTHEDLDRLRAAVEAVAGRLDEARGTVVEMERRSG